MARKQWTCRKCRTVNKHAAHKGRACSGCGEQTRPKKREPAHMQALADHDYGDTAVLSVLIHGGEPHACGCCGRPKPESGRLEHWHRDHDHVTGLPRGLACTYCNTFLIRDLTLEQVDRIHAFMHRADDFHRRAAIVGLSVEV
jgi:Recombination endonuclease VII